MAYKSKADLKLLFEDGDTPSGSDFTDLIDTLVAIGVTGASFGAGSIPLVVTGTNSGVVENAFVGIKSSGGVQKAGTTADGMTFDNVGNYFKMQHYPIGTWDMVTTANKSISIASEIPTRAQVLAVLVKIVSDTGQVYGPRSDLYWSMNADGIVNVTRDSGGFFQTAPNFNSTANSRGIITVIYDPTLT